MSSLIQIEANRINAQSSTGPTSAEGKAKTRLNAKRDGITGQVITLSEEDLPVFEKLKAALIDDLAPKTVMELHLASSIAWDTWRLDHHRAVEMNMYAAGAEDPECDVDDVDDVDSDTPELHTAMSGALTFGKESKKFALMSIYEQRINRGIHKNLELLRKLQAERKTNYQNDLEQETWIAIANDANGLPYTAPTRRSENGFIFSTSEVLAKVNRQSVLVMAGCTNPGPRKILFDGAWASFDPSRPGSGPHNSPNLGPQFATAA